MNLRNKQEKIENQDYIQISSKDLPDIFEIIDGKVYLKNSKALPIKVNLPIQLNEELAKIPAMILDGSISRTLNQCMFSQKKDITKVEEFNKIIEKIFNIKSHHYICKDTKTHIIQYPRKVFVTFLYYLLDIHKSDEDARIPNWIWNSPRSVIIEYLRYAFAMEGSISNTKTEVKFHSVKLSYLKQLKTLLDDKFEINSIIQSYYIKDYGWKYFLYIAYEEGIRKFSEIGFALNSHQKRLNQLISGFKNKAWEITLIYCYNLKKNHFKLSDIHKLLPNLIKRSIHHRLTDLVGKEYLRKEKIGYSITIKGNKFAFSIKNQVKFTKLRTYPWVNEQNIINFLNSVNKSYKNEIVRELKLSESTVRDTLNRLCIKNKIKYTGNDKFQRKFYEVNN